VSSFGGHSVPDRALREWNDWTMKSGKIDHFCDELMRLALALGYCGNCVKHKARLGITTALRVASGLKTPVPDEYVEYINLLRQTGHQLEHIASFNRTVTKEKHHFRPKRAMIGNRPLRDSKRIGKGVATPTETPQPCVLVFKTSSNRAHENAL